ncbi:MAG: hypothetical protein IPK72_15540 [Candidatus Eisenbacteria bacterium]|nr:hypothetical protein [Candidatus Eisenbacteria bacterium]
MPDSQREIPWPALAALCALLVVAPSLRGGFVWDDRWAIEQSPLLTQPGMLPRLLAERHGFGSMVTTDDGGSGYYRPLATLLHGLLLVTVGAKPFLFHLLSVSLHAGASAALALWLRRWRRNAAAAALLLSVHPVAADTAAWISATPDLLAALCVFLGLAAFDRRRYWRAGLLLLLAPLGKESGLVGLLWLGLTACARPVAGAPIGGRSTAVRVGVAALVGYLAVRAVTVGLTPSPAEIPPGLRIAGPDLVGRLFLMNGWRLLVPFPMTLEPFPWVVAATPRWSGWLGLALAGGLAALGLLALARGRRSWGLLLLPLAALLPVAQIIPTSDIFGGRFLYLPLAGLAAGLAALTPASGIGRPVRIAGVPLLLALAVGGWARASEWRDDRTLFGREIERNPASLRAQVLWAGHLLNGGQLEAARPWIEGLGRALPDHPRVRYQEALLWMNENRAAEAERVFSDLYRNWRQSPSLLANLAGCQLRLGKFEEGLRTLDQATANSTPTAGMRNNRGLALRALGRHQEARSEFEQAIVQEPDYRPARANLVFLLARELALPEEARTAAAEYLRRFPKGPEADAVRAVLGSTP